MITMITLMITMVTMMITMVSMMSAAAQLQPSGCYCGRLLLLRRQRLQRRLASSNSPLKETGD